MCEHSWMRAQMCRREGMPGVMGCPRGAFLRPPSRRGPPLGWQRCHKMCGHVHVCTHACKGMRTAISVPFHAWICMDVCPRAFPAVLSSPGMPPAMGTPFILQHQRVEASKATGASPLHRADTSLPAAAAEAGSAAVAGAGSGRARWGHGGYGRLRITGGTGRSERHKPGSPAAGILRRGPWRRQRRVPIGA